MLTFFGGEPLLNLPVVYYLAERLHGAAHARGVRVLVNIITNGLLLTPAVVARLKPFGLNGVKITLDGDQATHDRLRPLRGGQGTFDRIVANIRAIAGECRIAIGGNFDADSVESYPALLDFLAAQDFAPALSRVVFKPVIRAPQPLSSVDRAGRVRRAHPAHAGGRRRQAAGRRVHDRRRFRRRARPASACDSCHFVDEQMQFLRDETRRHGFATLDGVHMGPCEIHKRHAHTIGPEGSLYACPGFAGEARQSVGHIDGRADLLRARAAAEFDRIWRVALLRRLRLHPGVRRRLQRRLSHRTR